MGWNDRIDEQLSARLQAMIDQGYLDRVSDAARGIAKYVIEAGDSGLTEKQRYVYETEIVPALKKAPPDDQLL